MKRKVELMKEEEEELDELDEEAWEYYVNNFRDLDGVRFRSDDEWCKSYHTQINSLETDLKQLEEFFDIKFSWKLYNRFGIPEMYLYKCYICGSNHEITTIDCFNKNKNIGHINYIGMVEVLPKKFKNYQIVLDNGHFISKKISPVTRYFQKLRRCLKSVVDLLPINFT